VGRHPNEFRRMAIECFNSCENILALANELGIQRTLLYKWRKQFEADEAIGDSVPVNAREGKLRKELGYVKRLLAEKALEVDFFRGALQRVGARRQQNNVAGEKTSTTRSVAWPVTSPWKRVRELEGFLHRSQCFLLSFCVDPNLRM
jgi:transposase-like protein